MKRQRIAAAILALLLTGCSGTRDPYRVDTVVRIPVDPTEETVAAAETSSVPSETAETEASTEAAATAPTQKPKTSSGSGYKGSSSGGKKANASKATEAPTDPPTDPPTEEPSLPPTEAPTEPEKIIYDLSGYSVGDLEYAIADAINAARQEAELSSLPLQSRLCAIASARGYEATLLWSHTRPNGRWCSSILADHGYGVNTVTELLAYGDTDAGNIVSSWMHSESTRQAILSDRFTALGVGVYYDGELPYIACFLVG